MKKANQYILGLILGLSTLGAQAQQERSLPILTQGGDVASLALGATHYGNSRYAHIYTNPSAALYADRPLSISTYYQHQKVEAEALRAIGLAGSYRLGGRHALLIGTRYFGGLRHTEITMGEQQRKERALYDMTIELGYALRLGKWSPFVVGSYIISDQMRMVSTMTASLGVSYRDQLQLFRQQMDYTLTAKASNLGPSFTYIQRGTAVYPPSSLALGGELASTAWHHGVRLALGVEHFFAPREAASTQVQSGVEYSYRGLVMARAGYTHDTNGLSMLSLGLGGRYKALHLDLTYRRPNNSITSSQLIVGLGVSL